MFEASRLSWVSVLSLAFAKQAAEWFMLCQNRIVRCWALYPTLKSIAHVQVPTRCLQRRAGQVQTATPTLCATTWAGLFPACPRSSLPTSGLPAKSRSLSVASWTFRQDSLSHICIRTPTSAPQHCLVHATSALISWTWSACGSQCVIQETKLTVDSSAIPQA